MLRCPSFVLTVFALLLLAVLTHMPGRQTKSKSKSNLYEFTFAVKSIDFCFYLTGLDL